MARLHTCDRCSFSSSDFRDIQVVYISLPNMFFEEPSPISAELCEKCAQALIKQIKYFLGQTVTKRINEEKYK